MLFTVLEFNNFSKWINKQNKKISGIIQRTKKTKRGIRLWVVICFPFSERMKRNPEQILPVQSVFLFFTVLKGFVYVRCVYLSIEEVTYSHRRIRARAEIDLAQQPIDHKGVSVSWKPAPVASLLLFVFRLRNKYRKWEYGIPNEPGL